MYQPAYYLGRRVTVFRAVSHPCTYVYTWVRQQQISPVGVMSRNTRMRLARTDAYWQQRRRA